jgi:DNA-binding SARP family transcriptional activator/ABC-type transport system substrate-binding protein
VRSTRAPRKINPLLESGFLVCDARGAVTRVSCRILGRLEVLVDGRAVQLPSRRERALLGVLLLHLGDVVSVDALIDSVWGEPAPASARHMVHEYVSRLRGTLGDAAIATRAPGYAVERGTCELDAARFVELLAAARSAVAADDLEEALRTFDEGLGLWRGDALSDAALESDARVAAARLDDERRAARSERVEVALALGHHGELVPELERTVAAEPLDERVLRQLMLALYRSGRQADALARYRDGRRRLVDELGIEPSAELRGLEQAILRHDPRLAVPPRALPANGSRGSARRSRLAVGGTVVALACASAVVIAASLNAGEGKTAAPIAGDAIAIVDAQTSHLVGSIPLQSRPGAITAAAGSLWVADADSRTVARISPASRHVVASVTLDRAAQALAASAGKVWAVGSNPTDFYLTLDRINPTFDTAARVRRLPMILDGDVGSVAAGPGTVVVAPHTGLLTQIDARTGRVQSRTDPKVAPTAVAQGFGSTWLAYKEADVVVRVDATGATTSIPVGQGPSAITIGRSAVWVANAIDGTVMSIDPVSRTVIHRFSVGHAPAAIVEADRSVWIANAGDGTLTRIDERTGRRASIAVGGSPQALVVADGKVWVSVQPPLTAKPSGGTLVVSLPDLNYIKGIDPAIADAFDTNPIEYAICSSLLVYPDEPGPAGLQPVPDAARAAPTVTDGGRVYTFVIRPGLRFSPPSNELVTASTFVRTIERSLDGSRLGFDDPPGAQELSGVVVGAAAYAAGKARHVAGITARGDRLTIRLTHPAPDLPERLAGAPFCAVPSDMPLTPVLGSFPSAGPYYVADATPGRRLVLLRNPNYHGDRPRRPRRIVLIATPSQLAVGEVEASHVDYAIDGVSAGQSARLERLYGARSPAARAGRQRYFATRMFEVDTVDLNTSRPLFASARMRRAVNYAVDRQALAANGGTYFAHATVAQMLLPPGVPGFRDEHVYPLTPDLATARRLAGKGHHTANLYCLLQGGSPRAAQIIAHDLAAIDIDVHVRCMAPQDFWNRIGKPHAPWDMVINGGGSDANPGDFLDAYASSQVTNDGQLHDPRVDALIHAAQQRSGVARAYAYAKLDDVLVRDAVPEIAFANESSHDFFSARVGCQLYQPVVGMDLGALCIRTGRGASGPA